MAEQINYQQWMINDEGRLARVKLSGCLSDVIEAINLKLGYFLGHVFVKHAQSLSFKQKKANLSANTALFHFDFSENYQFVPQDGVQSGHWDHLSCTLFTVMVHYKDIHSDDIRSEPIVVVFDYMNHNKYAVHVFLNKVFESFEKSNPELQIEHKIFQSDGAAQHFKQKFTLCSMTLMDGDAEWNFSAMSHGKGEVVGLGGTCKRRVREKTNTQRVDPQTSQEFAECASEVCSGITVLHCTKEEIESAKSHLDKAWNKEDRVIQSIPGTRKSHHFKKVEPYIIGCQTVSDDASDYRCRILKDYSTSCGG